MPHGATYEGVHSTTSSDLDDRAQGRLRSADDPIVASGSVPRTTFSGRRFSRRSDRLSESSDQHDERPRGSGLAWQKRFLSGLRGSGRASMSEFVFAIA